MYACCCHEMCTYLVSGGLKAVAGVPVRWAASAMLFRQLAMLLYPDDLHPGDAHLSWRLRMHVSGAASSSAATIICYRVGSPDTTQCNAGALSWPLLATQASTAAFFFLLFKGLLHMSLVARAELLHSQVELHAEAECMGQ